MASGSSQAATLTPAPLRKHDVFLSFYGKDTRKGFSDHLYTALKNKGIFVYRDNEELKRGENISELLKAIQESEYAVIVISENYAFSKWCLKELTEIVRCQREYRLTILPIFYHVDPSNVRNQKGSFADGLATHGEEFMEEREKWRSALNEVSNIAGWHVHDSYESTIIVEVCKEIFAGLSRRLSYNFKDVVGIESQVKKIMTLIRARSMANDVHFIGICGMGGVGKTTLVQVIFNNISSEFEAACFVDDVRQKLQKFDIVHLQKEIICKILGDRNIEIWSCFDGIKVIANRLQDKKIFLVLDNVDEASQIEALAKERDWFGKGSRVFLISRNKQLLKGFVEEMYEVKGLSDNDALHLFCLKAFKKDHPIKSYENLSKEFVNYAHGLPLALKVFGSHLFENGLLIWESTLKRWKEEPHFEIWEKLKISFDGLSESQQQLFLDIACFFNGEPIEVVMQYLKDVGYHPESNIEVLQDRSLIKLSYERFKIRFKMHDLLQDMGRQIVRRESLKNPGERSRLWCSKDIIDVLENNTGTKVVEGIFLRLPLPEATKLNFESFSKLKKLKMLVIRPNLSYYCDDDKYNNEAFKHLKSVGWYGDPSKFMLSNELRILEWWGYPLRCLPTNFELDNLIEFKIPMSSIKHLWNVGKNLKKLKYVDMRDSQNLIEMPDFSRAPNLQKLNVKRTQIKQLSTILNLGKLNVLAVGGSFSKPVSLVVHGLPLNFKFLTKLNLSYCNLAEGALSNNLGYLSSLDDLDLSGNKFARVDFVSRLPNLTKLSLTNCERLKALPSKLSSLLDEILLENCPSLTTISEPRDILTLSEKLVASDMTLQAVYFGYNGQQYRSIHLGQSFMENATAASGSESIFYSAIKWGPTLTSNMPGWFASLPNISGTFQRRFEAEKSWHGRLGGNWPTSMYCEELKALDGIISTRWGYALFIVYEVFELDSCQRREEIFPVFVCELEVHKINDRKVPIDEWDDIEEEWRDTDTFRMESRTLEKVPTAYGSTVGKFPIVFRVPDIPSVGRNGVWVFMGSGCFENAGLEMCMDFGLCSISVSSLNVEVKECGGRLVLKNDFSECFEIIKSISPRDLGSKTLAEAIYGQGGVDCNDFVVHGPVIERKRGRRGEKGKRKKKIVPRWLTSLTSSGMLMATDIPEFEAFYFGYEDKRYRTYHWTQSFINDLHSKSFCNVGHFGQTRHFETVTWGPTLTSDIPEWFTSLPDISGIFQCRLIAQARLGYLSRPCQPAIWYYKPQLPHFCETILMVSSWGYALFIVYEIFQREGEIHEAEVDEHGNSSSPIFPEFVCELEVFAEGQTLGKDRIVFRVPDIPSVGKNGVWVFINGSCFRKAGLECCDDDGVVLECCDGVGWCSISISSPNVDVKECGCRVVFRNDSSKCYEIIKSISPHGLDSETLQDAFYEGGFKVFGNVKPRENWEEGKKQKGVETHEEGEKKEGGVEIYKEGEGEGEEEEEEVEICEKGEKEGVKICERVGEEEEGVEICCVSYLQKFFSFLQVCFRNGGEISINGSENCTSNSADMESSSSLGPQTRAEQVGLTTTTEDVPLENPMPQHLQIPQQPVNVGYPQIDLGKSSHYQPVFEIGQSSHQQTFEQYRCPSLQPNFARNAGFKEAFFHQPLQMQNNQPPPAYDQHRKPVLMTLPSPLPDLVASQHPRGILQHSNSSHTFLRGKHDGILPTPQCLHEHFASINTLASGPGTASKPGLLGRSPVRSNDGSLELNLWPRQMYEDEDEDEPDHNALQETFSSGSSNTEESEDYYNTEYASPGSLSETDVD